MRIINRSIFAWNVALVLIIAVGLGVTTAVATPLGPWPGILVLLIGLYVISRKPLRRWRAVRRGLPQAARRWIEENVPLYRALDDEGRARFEQDVMFVLDEWAFEGVEGVEVTDELRAAVGAGAAVLLHGHPEWEMPSRHTALFYPGRFDDDYLTGHRGDLDGMAHAQGPVILSVEALEADWADPTNGHNVVLHELAHLLDFKDAFVDDEPEFFADAGRPEKDDLIEREMRRIRSGHSVLRRYGATNRAEFFAVAVESFFERPHILASQHRELHQALVDFFGYDPKEVLADV